MITFDFPYILICIPVILLVWYFIFREKIGYTVPNSLLRKYISNPKSIVILWILRTLLVSCAIGILAGPSLYTLKKVTETPSSHILIILDISRSMLATDILPDRITAAKDTIHTFLTKRKGEKIGLILFAGKPFLSIPFSDDYLGIKSTISHISPYMIRQELPGLSGTAIGDALLLGIGTFSGVVSDNKHIILFTDGRVNIGIDPRNVLDTLSSEHMNVYTIGIGTLSGGTIPGNGIIESSGGTTLDEALLQELATKSGGKYFHVTESENLDSVLQDIDTTITRNPQEKIEEKRIDERLSLTLILCLLLLFEYVLRGYISKKYHLL